MTTFSLPTAAHVYAQSQRDPAAELFNEARMAGQRRAFWSGLVRRSTALRALSQAQTGALAGRYAGRQDVKLKAIRGTEGRPGDFDDQFHPLSDTTRKRWQSVASAVEAGVTLPPVQLIRVGDTYYVRDGHHRVSVARALGQETIEAEVTVWGEAGSVE